MRWKTGVHTMSKATKTVDFFIVGAPKCATTALVHGLRQNPTVLFSSRKEPHYFSTDLVYPQPKPESDQAYIETYFPADKRAGDIWGDGSVWHLFSEVALEKIKAFNPQARIVVMLRDPAKAAFSLHQMRVFQGHETVKEFRKAWNLSQARYDREGFSGMTKTIRNDPRNMAYRHAFTFHPQLTRLFETFPKEQIMILKQEELVADGAKALKNVGTFIGAPAFEYRTPQKENSTFYLNNKLLLNVMRSSLTKRVAEQVKKHLGIRSFKVGKPSLQITPEDVAMVHRDLADDMAAVKRDFGITLVKKIVKT